MQKNNQEEKLNLALLYHKEGQEQNHQKAFELFQECLIQGDVRANLYLGIIFEKGLGVSQNLYKAKEFFTEAYKSGIKGASAYLGSFYLYGKACKQDYQQALKLFCEATRECNPLGDFYLGIMYEEGLLVKKSEKRAVACYESAGQEGVLEAYYRLGAMYAQGRGVRKNKKKATELLALSCGDRNTANQEKNNGGNEAREALNNIVKKDQDKKMYYEIGVDLYDKEQYEDALNFFLKGIKLDCDKCYFYLGKMYEEGNGVTQDSNKTIFYYKKAYSLGNYNASYRLGLIYEYGEIVEQDYKKAMHYFYATCKKSDSKQIVAYSLHSIASFYEYGQGVKQNLNKAIEKYLESLEIYQNEFALLSLGSLYEYEDNYEQAIYYYKSACDLKSVDAFISLGKLYGEKLEQYTNAIETYKKALEIKPNDKEKEELFFALGNMYYCEKNIKESTKYFWSAAQNGNIDAHCMLAKIYSDSSFREYDWDLAVKLARMVWNSGKRLPYIEKILNKQEEIQKQQIDIENKKNNLQRQKVDSNELFQIGYAFLKSKNYKKAYDYFLDSFEMGNLDSCVNLGYMFENGLGVDENLEKAKDYYQKASKSNHKIACYNLGVMYKKGRGVDKDFEKALKYFQISSNQGDCDSAYEMGKIYEVQKKFQLAREAYIIAYQLGKQKALIRYEKIKNRPNIFDKIFGYFAKGEK